MQWLIVAVLLAASPDPPAGAAAQSAEDRKLEQEIARELGAPSTSAAPLAAAPATATAAASAGGATGGNPLARLMLLPDISAIGSFAGAYDTLDVARLSPRSGSYGDPHKITPIFQELELGLQAVIDSYARADIFLSFTPEGAEVEEAYLTTLALPAGFQLRAGKFFSPFGRLNQQHPHAWDFVDAPLAMDRLLSADTLKGPGLDVAWLAPLPWFAELHLAGQTARPAFATDDRRTVGARLQQFFDVADGTTIGLGFSGARVETTALGASDLIGGADLLLKLRPVGSRSAFVLQAELFARDLSGSADAHNRIGGYVQAVYRGGPYWAFGVRGEAAPAAVPGTTTVTNDSGTEYRTTALATWMPSEFQRIRAQVAWDRLPGARDGVEALVHLEFIIGAHGAHPF